MLRGFSIGKIFGISIEINPSWIFIFVLVTFNLAVVIFPGLHPDWGAALNWSVGLAASLLFFASVLAHELAHSLVAKARGLPVRRITLFLFGGVSNLEQEPQSPKIEFLMAIVGPATSIILGIIFLLLGNLLAKQTIDISGDPIATFSKLDPVSTLLLWLGPINIIVGLFNLIPGFPLDGGRVLRSILWAISGNLFSATKYASLIGRGVAWLFIIAGISMVFGINIPILGTGLGSGLWLVLIGWFLNNAASVSFQQIVINKILEKVTVSRLMQKDITKITPDIFVDKLVDDYMMQTDQKIFPVMKNSHMVGQVSARNVKKIPKDKWDEKKVKEIMTPYKKLETVSPEKNAAKALDILIRGKTQEIAVTHNKDVLGLLRLKDITKWLELHADEFKE